VFSLIGHLAGTFVLFVALLGVVWLASLAVKLLNDVHPFPQNIMQSIQQIEIVFFWLDSFLCLILLIVGAASFMREISRRNPYEIR
jgi:uncharacterized protein YhhL (DUF1145 family)